MVGVENLPPAAMLADSMKDVGIAQLGLFVGIRSCFALRPQSLELRVLRGVDALKLGPGLGVGHSEVMARTCGASISATH